MQTRMEFASTRFTLDLEQLSNDEERAVMRALRYGRSAARSVPTLAEETGLPPRRVQSIVKHLIFRHGVPVGTSMGRPAGNYLIDDPEDLEATTELLRVRAIQSLARVAALQKMNHRRLLEEIQPELDAVVQEAQEAA